MNYWSCSLFLIFVNVYLYFPESEQETETVAPPPKPAEPVVASPKVVGGKYVPPGKRGGDSGSTPSGPSSRLGFKKKSAPQINNEQEFPSLAASSDLAKHTWVGHLTLLLIDCLKPFAKPNPRACLWLCTHFIALPLDQSVHNHAWSLECINGFG